MSLPGLVPFAAFGSRQAVGESDEAKRFRRDFPETEAAKFARGRLALPQMLAQFERESNVDEDG